MIQNFSGQLYKFAIAYFEKGIDMQKIPSFFLGHGSPMNAIENNLITTSWANLGMEIGKPQAILVISAHWYSEDLLLTAQQFNTTIHDFYGFPAQLMEYEYSSKGSKTLAHDIQKILTTNNIGVNLVNNVWGLDHGVWSILVHMLPNPQIPILQLSIPQNKPLQWYFDCGKALRLLREDNILIIGSGNIVHNLSKLDWYQRNSGYKWAIAFDQHISQLINDRNFEQILQYADLGDNAALAVPTLEHFLPLLYILGLAEDDDEIKLFNQSYEYGSLSMTSIRVG